MFRPYRLGPGNPAGVEGLPSYQRSPDMTTLADLRRAVEIAKRIWKDKDRQDRVIQALIRRAARTITR